MKDQEINIAIEEFIRPALQGNIYRPPRDYCNDFNSMHEAEKTFLTDGSDSDLYLDYLMAVVASAPAGLSNHATARQRAEAFLRTIGKWKERAK